jgi:hypothetical protein
MDEFDDFDIGPQADEFASMDADENFDLDFDGEDTIVDEDEVIHDDDDLRHYNREWDEDQDEDFDWDND